MHKPLLKKNPFFLNRGFFYLLGEIRLGAVAVGKECLAQQT